MLAAGAWFGALLPVLAILRLPDRRQGTATALRRFSRAGHAAGALSGLRAATLAEVPLGCAALGLVAVFGLMDPN